MVLIVESFFVVSWEKISFGDTGNDAMIDDDDCFETIVEVFVDVVAHAKTGLLQHEATVTLMCINLIYQCCKESNPTMVLNFFRS